jgi:hypothetical protein
VGNVTIILGKDFPASEMANRQLKNAPMVEGGVVRNFSNLFID